MNGTSVRLFRYPTSEGGIEAAGAGVGCAYNKQSHAPYGRVGLFLLYRRPRATLVENLQSVGSSVLQKGYGPALPSPWALARFCLPDLSAPTVTNQN